MRISCICAYGIRWRASGQVFRKCSYLAFDRVVLAGEAKPEHRFGIIGREQLVGHRGRCVGLVQQHLGKSAGQ